MVTQENINSEVVEIEWERDEEIDIHDHEVHYACFGESDDKRRWTGTWVQIDGDNGIAEIIEVEEDRKENG